MTLTYLLVQGMDLICQNQYNKYSYSLDPLSFARFLIRFIEIMAPVFSREAWRCVWHMIQNDLVHGWGLDFALRKCVEPAHEKIGVVDSQWIIHQKIPSLGSQVIKWSNFIFLYSTTLFTSFFVHSFNYEMISQIHWSGNRAGRENRVPRGKTTQPRLLSCVIYLEGSWT